MPDYTAQFNQERAKSRIVKKKKFKISGIIAQKMTKALEDKQSWVWPVAYALAIFNDFGDILIIGSIPILGDTFDIFCVVTLTIFFYNIGGMIKWKIRVVIWTTGGIETILGVLILPEMMPFWILCVWYARHQVNKRAELANMGLGQLKRGKIDGEIAANFS